MNRTDYRYVKIVHETIDLIDNLKVVNYAVNRLTETGIDTLKTTDSDGANVMLSEITTINRLLQNIKHRALDLYCSNHLNLKRDFMKVKSLFRAATVNDCPKIAQLFSIATDGVANYIWSTLQADYPGLTLFEIGTKRYAQEQTDFSYQNCVVVEYNDSVIAMMVNFPLKASGAESERNSEVAARSEISVSEPNVLTPYYSLKLKAPATWYIGGLAVFLKFRCQGIGTQLLSIARLKAQEQGFQELSLLVFEQNERAVKLYKRNGFKVIERMPVVPHELIHYVGNVLLMTAPI